MTVTLALWQFEFLFGMVTVVAVTNLLIVVELVLHRWQRDRHHELTKNPFGPVR